MALYGAGRAGVCGSSVVCFFMRFLRYRTEEYISPGEFRACRSAAWVGVPFVVAASQLGCARLPFRQHWVASGCFALLLLDVSDVFVHLVWLVTLLLVLVTHLACSCYAEVVNGVGQTSAVDWWTLGILIWEVRLGPRRSSCLCASHGTTVSSVYGACVCFDQVLTAASSLVVVPFCHSFGGRRTPWTHPCLRFRRDRPRCLLSVYHRC